MKPKVPNWGLHRSLAIAWAIAFSVCVVRSWAILEWPRYGRLREPAPEPVWTLGLIVAVPLIVLAVAGMRTAAVRTVLRGLAMVHGAAALLMIRMHGEVRWETTESGALEFLLWYTAFNVTLPALVVLLLPRRLPTVDLDDLPPEVAFMDHNRDALSAYDRVTLVLIMSLVVPAFMMGGLLLLAFALPVGMAIYWLGKLITQRRDVFANVARRMRLAPKMRKPAQQRSYWTVNAAEFNNPNQFEQAPPRAKIRDESPD